MGHIVNYKAHNGFVAATNYCYPATTGSCAWSFSSAEYGAEQFEEALATFDGDTALYFKGNSEPHSCLSSSYCTGSGSDIERSTANVSTCVANEDRFPVSAMRYLRDVYDSTADYSGDNDQLSYYKFLDTMDSWSAGTSDDQKDEPWNASFTAIDAEDGRSTNDMATALFSFQSVNSTSQLNMNCDHVGN